ncbi:MAG: hypothetical protein U9Q93_16435 [Pseudomonadota bacterium]|nr:hypothetical protein [Pseudomonadota bacterium]
MYGIDGADRRIFDYFEMPFYEELSKTFSFLNVEEDLLNRGWSEIATGRIGKDTGGLYMSPDLDGTHGFSMTYSMAEVPSKTDARFLWDEIGADIKVGIMNVPSLNPVPKVNGFVVGSAGAGISRISRIGPEIAFPESVAKYLDEAGYVPDIRVGPSGITEIQTLFSELKKMETVRIRCFIDLIEKNDIQFGFLIDRATAVVQYLFMSEIKAMMDRDRGLASDFEPTPLIESLLRDFYSFIDKNIQKLFEVLGGNQFILVSDHGQEAMTHHLNPNVLLQKGGYYFPGVMGGGSTFGRLYRYFFSSVPRKYRAWIRNQLSSLAVDRIEKIGVGFDKRRTKAFSHWYMPGIYINDERFYSVVKGPDKEEVVLDICYLINNDPKSQECGISASPYRELYSDSVYSDALPDIKINMPDSIFVTCRSDEFVSKNPGYGPVPDLNKVQSDMHTGSKARNPICLIDPKSASLLKDAHGVFDLTVVNVLVKSFFRNGCDNV